MAKTSKKVVKKARKQYTKDDAGKTERFKDFANNRVPRAIKAIRAVGKLASGSSYKYSAEDAQKICAALAAEYNRLKMAFEGKKPAEETFKLD